MLHKPLQILCVIALLFVSCKKETVETELVLEEASVGEMQLDLQGGKNQGVLVDRAITLVFSSPVNPSSAREAITLKKGNANTALDISLTNDNRTVLIYPTGTLDRSSTYALSISSALKGAGGATFVAKTINFTTIADEFSLLSIKAGDQIAENNLTPITDVPLDLNLTLEFSNALDSESAKTAIRITNVLPSNLNITLSADKKSVHIQAKENLAYLRKFELNISEALRSEDGQTYNGLKRPLYTTIDPTPKFPILSDDALLTLVQRQTFKYFWDFAHPSSGMARERNTSGNTVTSGGSGFGLMAIIVGIERGFISRQQGIDRLNDIVSFLETADRFHGAWSHWLNGNTGDALPFSANDNGGDLVETSLLVQGLITFRQYLNASVAAESQLINRINALWQAVEWDWYTRGGSNVLYWHWSADKGWAMNLQINGWNESLITYLLAASSPTHPISKAVYSNGWARNGAMRNGNSFEDLTLPLGPNYGGPLFFSHYSFLGLDPRNLSDEYANYWEQNVNHTLINYRYSVRNPKNYVGYGDACWGLTASDGDQGYSAHSPTNDRGVITPTAALSSFPYTPEESMRALKFYYYSMGDRLWGEYGFYDAFNITEEWVANSYLAIDQGPIIIMIENHRTGLLWDLFMSAPEIKSGLNKLGFNY